VVLDWNESGGTVWVGRRADVLMAAAPVGPAPSEAVAAWLLARLDREIGRSRHPRSAPKPLGKDPARTLEARRAVRGNNPVEDLFKS
jgi:hypothetical protein